MKKNALHTDVLTNADILQISQKKVAILFDSANETPLIHPFKNVLKSFIIG